MNSKNSESAVNDTIDLVSVHNGGGDGVDQHLVVDEVVKLSSADLAIFGGKKAFDRQYHIGGPNVGDREAFFERVNDIFDRRYFTNGGPYMVEFEKAIAEYVGVKNCVSVCNATVALEIVSRAAGMKGEVIVPAFTAAATVHALQWQEITPVFCDIDPITHSINPGRIEELITPRTTGIIGVHLWGQPCDVDALTEIAERRGLTLLLDAAHAFGSSYQGRMLGSFGRAEVFSFHATKFLNSFEGGAVVTNDDELAHRVRLMRNFGFVHYDDVAYLGTNGKITEVCAAMGLTSLESMDEFIDVNRRNYHAYQRGLNGIEGVRLVEYDENERCNYQYIILEIDEDLFGLSRDQVQLILHAEDILARRYFYPGCHRMEPYRSFFPHAGLLLPVTERVASRVLSLPTGTPIGVAEIERIWGLLRDVSRLSGEIKDAWETRKIRELAFPRAALRSGESAGKEAV